MDFTPIQHTTLPSGPLAYRHTGTGLPLLLIHGWRGSSRHWQDTMDTLADCRAVYAIDLPGHGETPPWQEQITTEGLAKHTLEFADQLGLERFDLVGHSFGSAVAVAIAAQAPERVRRLVITSLGTVRTSLERFALVQAHQQMEIGLAFWRPWFAMMRPWPGLWQSWVDFMGSQPAVSRTFAGSFMRQLPPDDEVVREGVVEFLSADPLSAMEIAVSAGSPTFFPALSKIVAPALVVSGDSDQLMPRSGVEALAEQLSDGRLVELAGCGHLPMIEQPEAYHRLVREFLLAGD